MAKIGLNNFRYSLLTEAEDGTPSYAWLGCRETCPCN